MDDTTAKDTPALGRMAQAIRLPTATRWSAELMRMVFFLCGASVLLIAGAILIVLLGNSALFFGEVSIVEFFTHAEWRAIEGPLAAYGVWPLVTGTLLVAGGAALIGLPLGLGTAIYLAEYATPRVRGTLKPVLELLAGIPSIVYGFFALKVISPIVRDATAEGTLLGAVFGDAAVFSAANAMIVVGIMVLPIVSSLSEDAIRAVPKHLKEASLGLGATRWETTRHVVLPAALSGITASFVLGVARAIGETMAVAMAAGTQANFTLNPVDAIQTMTAFIAQRMTGDIPHDGAVFHSLFAVGAALFALTLGLNTLARMFVKRYQEVDR